MESISWLLDPRSLCHRGHQGRLTTAILVTIRSTDRSG
jgi:hypothetical protein